MSKHILQDLPELINANVISEDTGQRIREYYNSKPAHGTNRLLIVFGILGALLVGMGITLIIAHNWDDLSKPIKLFFALLPLLLGQGFCAFSIYKKNESTAWKESSATFLVFAIASSISIVGQVYNLEGNFPRFLLVWMLLTLPVIYAMRSSLASLLFIIGVTWYASEVSYFKSNSQIAWWYWLLILAMVPHYFMLLKRHSKSNFFNFHTWLITLSLLISLGMFSRGLEEITILVYINFFGLLISIGQLKPFAENRLITNAPLVVGSMGTTILLLTLSFSWYWEEISRSSFNNWNTSVEFYLYIITTALATLGIYVVTRQKKFNHVNAKSLAYAIVLVLFYLGMVQPVLSHVVVNLLIFVTGIFTIRDGALQNRLGILNYGLFILTALIICRFFDMDISFVARGLMFVIIGAGFFVANYWMIKKKKEVPNV